MYLDPSSWSMVLQAVIGTVVAIPVLLGIYWRQVKAFFLSRRKNAKD